MEAPGVDQGENTERQRVFEREIMTAHGIIQAACGEIYKATSLEPEDVEQILRVEADRIDKSY